MSAEPLRVAIVGAGAAGCLAAVGLVDRAPVDREVEIQLIDRTGSFARGIAYGTTDPRHLLNVPAVRMGAIAGRPEHFLEWLRGRGEDVDEASFVPRSTYGEYLEDLLRAAEADTRRKRVLLRRRTGAVTAIAAAPDGSLAVAFEDGDELVVDHAVLALGPPRGAAPAEVPESLRASGVYLDDPWAPGALAAAREAAEVLVLGTGLTMIDVALSLAAGTGPRVRAVSRGGLMPRRHRRDLTRMERFPLPIEAGELDPIVEAFEARVAVVARSGGDWRDVVDSLRPAVPEVWRALKLDQKRRFLAELQREWDVHRFRMAPDVADQLESLCHGGRVRWGKATVLGIEAAGAGARVTLADEDGIGAVTVDRIINCTGFRADLVAAPPAPLADLLAAGLVRLEPLGIGLDVDRRGAAVEASGIASTRISVLGALRKGVEWEALGMTEIREQADAVANLVYRSLSID